MPLASHGLVDKGISPFIINELLSNRIKPEITAETKRNNPHINDGARPVTVHFIQCKRFARSYRVGKYCYLRFRVRQGINQFLQVGNI